MPDVESFILVLFKPISDVLGFLPIDSNTLSTLIMSENKFQT